jgi:hypothetical protein
MSKLKNGKIYVKCEIKNLKCGGIRQALLLVQVGPTMHDEIKKNMNRNEVLVSAILAN